MLLKNDLSSQNSNPKDRLQYYLDIGWGWQVKYQYEHGRDG